MPSPPFLAIKKTRKPKTKAPKVTPTAGDTEKERRKQLGFRAAVEEVLPGLLARPSRAHSGSQSSLTSRSSGPGITLNSAGPGTACYTKAIMEDTAETAPVGQDSADRSGSTTLVCGGPAAVAGEAGVGDSTPTDLSKPTAEVTATWADEIAASGDGAKGGTPLAGPESSSEDGAGNDKKRPPSAGSLSDNQPSKVTKIVVPDLNTSQASSTFMTTFCTEIEDIGYDCGYTDDDDISSLNGGNVEAAGQPVIKDGREGEWRPPGAHSRAPTPEDAIVEALQVRYDLAREVERITRIQNKTTTRFSQLTTSTKRQMEQTFANFEGTVQELVASVHKGFLDNQAIQAETERKQQERQEKMMADLASLVINSDNNSRALQESMAQVRHDVGQFQQRLQTAELEVDSIGKAQQLLQQAQVADKEELQQRINMETEALSGGLDAIWTKIREIERDGTTGQKTKTAQIQAVLNGMSVEQQTLRREIEVALDQAKASAAAAEAARKDINESGGAAAAAAAGSGGPREFRGLLISGLRNASILTWARQGQRQEPDSDWILRSLLTEASVLAMAEDIIYVRGKQQDGTAARERAQSCIVFFFTSQQKNMAAAAIARYMRSMQISGVFIKDVFASDKVELSRKREEQGLALKRAGYCQAYRVANRQGDPVLLLMRSVGEGMQEATNEELAVGAKEAAARTARNQRGAQMGGGARSLNSGGGQVMIRGQGNSQTTNTVTALVNPPPQQQRQKQRTIPAIAEPQGFATGANAVKVTARPPAAAATAAQTKRKTWPKEQGVMTMSDLNRRDQEEEEAMMQMELEAEFGRLLAEAMEHGELKELTNPMNRNLALLELRRLSENRKKAKGPDRRPERRAVAGDADRRPERRAVAGDADNAITVDDSYQAGA